jgi:hypothetical protein
VAGVAAAGTGAVLDGVAATDTDEDSTAVVDFTALGITDSTVAGAGSLEDFFPGGSRQSFLSRSPTLGTADTDMDTATVKTSNKSLRFRNPTHSTGSGCAAECEYRDGEKKTKWSCVTCVISLLWPSI